MIERSEIYRTERFGGMAFRALKIKLPIMFILMAGSAISEGKRRERPYCFPVLRFRGMALRALNLSMRARQTESGFRVIKKWRRFEAIHRVAPCAVSSHFTRVSVGMTVRALLCESQIGVRLSLRDLYGDVRLLMALFTLCLFVLAGQFISGLCVIEFFRVKADNLKIAAMMLRMTGDAFF